MGIYGVNVNAKRIFFQWKKKIVRTWGRNVCFFCSLFSWKKANVSSLEMSKLFEIRQFSVRYLYLGRWGVPSKIAHSLGHCTSNPWEGRHTALPTSRSYIVPNPWFTRSYLCRKEKSLSIGVTWNTRRISLPKEIQRRGVGTKEQVKLLYDGPWTASLRGP
jgi:hypothetical protein